MTWNRGGLTSFDVLRSALDQQVINTKPVQRDLFNDPQRTANVERDGLDGDPRR